MITLHRLGRPNEEIYLNSELIVTVEANPDTVITLSNGDKIVVDDSPEVVAQKIRLSRADVMSMAMLLSGETVPAFADGASR